LKEIIPRLSRLTVLANSSEPANAKTLREIELAAAGFGVQFQSLDVLDSSDLQTAFRVTTQAPTDALLVLASAVLTDHRTEIANLAIRRRLPTMSFSGVWVESGGLMSYGPSLPDLARRAATYVEKILKGAKPADLPVEQPTKFELVINLKTAKQIGLTISPNVLARADRVSK
jgi:putative ABC transport system substrate-binding protein